MRFDLQDAPCRVQDPDDAHISTEQFHRTREDLIKGLAQGARVPQPRPYLVQPSQGRTLLRQLRFTLAELLLRLFALGEQGNQNSVKSVTVTAAAWAPLTRSVNGTSASPKRPTPKVMARMTAAEAINAPALPKAGRASGRQPQQQGARGHQG
jgi:hypothetical protein